MTENTNELHDKIEENKKSTSQLREKVEENTALLQKNASHLQNIETTLNNIRDAVPFLQQQTALGNIEVREPGHASDPGGPSSLKHSTKGTQETSSDMDKDSPTFTLRNYHIS
ncbi:hypothetical protein LSAT2_014619 [Lamellibrachia satsuma]|nr:hypothetical protein LSAT2_014619 [Lamellibrachia satsuma]